MFRRTICSDEVGALAQFGITKGCDPPLNFNFCPDDPVTRGQMAAFLVRAFSYADDGGGDLFTDDDGSVFEGDIDRLGTAGVTRGCNPPANDQFCPDEAVTRDQMASFLGRALGLDPAAPPEPPPGPSGEFTVVFVAVRQGDAAIYMASCGEMGLIDANRFRDAEILAAIDDLGSRDLEWISVSHYDADHLGAVVDVATAPGVSVNAVYDRGGDGNAGGSYPSWGTDQQPPGNRLTRKGVQDDAGYPLAHFG